MKTMLSGKLICSFLILNYCLTPNTLCSNDEADVGGIVISTDQIRLELDDEKSKHPPDFADAGYARVRNPQDFLTSDPSNAENGVTTPVQNSVLNYEGNRSKIQDPIHFKRDDALQSSGMRTVLPNQKPFLFFIHGIGGSADSWSEQLKYFSDRMSFECVALDMLGHGFSSAPDKQKAYTFQKLLRDTLTVFDHFTSVSAMNNSLDQPRECIVVGHSYGCAFATAISRLRPDNVKLLVLIASGGPTPLAPPQNYLSMSPSMLKCCLLPFSKCRATLGKAKLGAEKRPTSTAAVSVATRRSRNSFYQNVFDVPSYVIQHSINGQYWPEGKLFF